MKFPSTHTSGEQVGKGAEKIVRNFGDEQNVIKEYNHESDPILLKGRFYLAKILHTLYPLQFPDIHTVGSIEREEERRHSFIVTEKRKLDEKHIGMATLLHKTTSQNPKALTEEDQVSYRELEGSMKKEQRGEKVISELGSLSVGFDKQLRNFSRDAEGEDTYLDIIEAFKQDRVTGKYTTNYDKELLRQKIESLSDTYSQEKTLAHLERLDVLLKELQS